MLTPLRKGWFFSPRKEEANGGLFGKGKGKGKAVEEGDGETMQGQNSGGEDGVEELAVEKKEREALVMKIVKLETELYDYQYNMGVLLLEKKELNTKYEEMQEEFLATESALKQENDAHLISISDLEKREVNLKKGLGVEKQCVADLEKALHDMRTECAEMKFTSDQKVQEAQILMEKVEEKSSEAEAKLCFADAKIAEIKQKSSELEQELQDLSVREDVLRREHASLTNEKQLHLEDLDRQRDDLRVWDRNLREGQERLVRNQSLLNQREERTNQKEEVLMKKEKELELLKDSLDKKNISLKEEENLINTSLSDLSVREKEADIKNETLEKKEKDLLAMEEKIIEREKVEIQKLLDDHTSLLDIKRCEFEIEMENKKKRFDEEMQEKLTSVQNMEKEINKKEDKLHKREQALENKTKKLVDNRKDLEMRSNSLKVLEVATRNTEWELDEKSKKIDEDIHKLFVLKTEIDAEKKTVECEKMYLLTEKENLKITEQERAEFVELQSKLRHEIDNCGIMKESLAKEREDLRREIEKFEREWDALDEKRAVLIADTKQFSDEKDKFEKWKHNEEEKFNIEKMEARDHIKNELNELQMKKEAFENIMDHEKSEARDMFQQERADMARNLDIRKHELEINVQKKMEELENNYQEKVSEFNAQRNTKMNHINSLRDFAASEGQKLKLEQNRFERDKQDYVNYRKELEENQHEIQHDIEKLQTLSVNLKGKKERFIKERDHFSSVVEQLKTCKNCGVTFDDVILPYLEAVREIDDPKDVVLLSPNNNLDSCLKTKAGEVTPLGNGSHTGNSGGRMTWLRNCTKKIFSFSPGTKGDDDLNMDLNRVATNGGELDDASDAEKSQSEDLIIVASKEIDQGREQPDPYLEICDSAAAADIQRIGSSKGIENIVNEPVFYVNEQNEMGLISPLPENSTQNQVPKKKIQRGRSKIMKNREGYPNPTYKLGAIAGQKRNFVQASDTATIEMDENNETHSESALGGPHKKLQTDVPDVVAAKDRRYNFRRSTVAGKATGAIKKIRRSKGIKLQKHPQLSLNESSQDVQDESEGTSKYDQPWKVLDRETDGEICMLNKSTAEKLNNEEVHDFSLQNSVQVGTEMVKSDDLGMMRGEEGEESSEGKEATPSAVPEDSCATEKCQGDDDNDDQSDSEEYNASVGKKLWRFLTT